ASSAVGQNRQTGSRSGAGPLPDDPGAMPRTSAASSWSPVAAAGSRAEIPAEASAASSSRRNRGSVSRPDAMLSAMPDRPRVSELRVPNLGELDFAALRSGRLARLQTMLKRHDMPVALLYNTANVRYATGVDVMAIWTAGTFARYCLVPAEGAPILFEYSGSMHVSGKIVRDVRPAYTWRYGGYAARDKAREWARSIRAALGERGLERERLAVDKLDTPGFLALQEENIAVVDVGPATVDAREVKTPEEVQLFAVNGSIGDAMLAEFEAAIRPGIREYELLAVLSDSLLRRQGEGLFTRVVAYGPNENPG